MKYWSAKVPIEIKELFDSKGWSPKFGFEKVKEFLKGDLTSTPTVQSPQSSFRASDIRKQIDLALESERERIAIQVLLLFQEHTSFSGYFESGKTNQKYDLDLSVNVPHDVLTQMKEQLE